MASAALGTALQQIHKLFNEGTVAALPDDQLLARFSTERDEASFEALVARHGPMVLAVCRSTLRDEHAAEDAFQATFLILARKAGSIWVRDSLGGWLHRVAYRMAVRADVDRRTRRDREGNVPCRAERDGSWNDWLPVLHEEIDRLPHAQRAPIVLCDLQELTYEQAAQQLSWTVPTLRCRLARGREQLRRRLTRRGMAGAGVALGTLAGSRVASAAVPTALVRSSVAAATTGATATTAATLASAMIRATRLARWQAAAAVTLAAGALALASTGLSAAGGDPPNAQAPPPAPAMAPPTRQAERPDRAGTLEVAGRVLGPDGKPFAGAAIWFQGPPPRQFRDPADPPPPNATSDRDGRFRFRVAAPAFGALQRAAFMSHPTVSATADGHGPGFVAIASADAAKELTLRLVKDDVPVEGRLIDLEGRPLAGVTVAPVLLFAAPSENLDAFEKLLAEATENGPFLAALSKSLYLRPWDRALAVKTGGDGRFQLHGIGRERVVSLRFEGPTVVSSLGSVHARTRPGPNYRIPQERKDPGYGTLTYLGATFELALAPTRPIVGVVRDRESGTPLAGVSIRSDCFAGNVVHGHDHVRTTTDAQGRYRLVGMPAGPGNRITATLGPEQPYLGDGAEVAAGNGLDPVEVNFALERGVLIRGRVTNLASGSPVTAVVSYSVFADNPKAALVRGLHSEEVTTRDDGTFQLVGLSGRGLLAVRAEGDNYLRARGLDAIAGAKPNELFPLQTTPRIYDRHLWHSFTEIKPGANAEPVTYNLVVDPGKSIRGTVVGPDGEPLLGVSAVALRPHTMSPNNVKLPTAEFTAVGLDPKDPRPVFFLHREKGLAGFVMLRGDEADPPVVRLQPGATVTGRLLDADGDPRTGYRLNCKLDAKAFGGQYLSAWYLRPTVDKEGRFRVENLTPGLAYELDAIDSNRVVADVAQGLVLKPGESKDLGDIRSRPGE